MKNYLLACASVAALAAAATSASAQTTTAGQASGAPQAAPVDNGAPVAPAGATSLPTSTAQASEPGLGDIVVTAQKRSENIQKVPISIQAFSGSTLKQANINTLLDLSKLSPTLNVSVGSQIANARVAIRGIGSGSGNGVEASVATFLDGIYIPRPGSLLGAYFDIDAIEVLSGPQGTLFGRNASVGAISLRSASPTGQFSGQLNLEGGTGNRYKANGFINLPVNENLAFRVAGLVQRFKGYWHDETTGDEFGGLNTYAVRVSMRARLSDKLTWNLKGDFLNQHGDNLLNAQIDPNSITAAQAASLRTLLKGTYPETDVNSNGNFISPAGAFDHSRNYGLASDLSYNLGGDYTLRLISSYRVWHEHQNEGELTYMPIPIFSRVSFNDSKSDSQELQFLSPKDKLLGGRLDFVVGLYYFHEKFFYNENFNFLANYCDIIVDRAAPALDGVCRSTPGANSTVLNFNQTLRSYAAYTQANFKILPSLSAVLGARYTKDTKDGDFSQALPNPAGASVRAAEVDPNLHLSESKPTYKVGLNWTPARDVLVFASYSTGFKSGGFNAGGVSASLAGKRTFAAETNHDIEIGLKSQLFDRHLTFNVTGFRMKLSNYQERNFDGLSFLINNVGSLRQQGVEVNGAVSANSFFRFNYAFTYLDSKFLSYRNASGLPGFGGTQDLSGQRANFSPKFTGSVGPELRGTLAGPDLKWSLRSDVNFTSSFLAGAVTDGNQQTLQSGYALLSARLTVTDVKDGLTFAVFGSNLTDKGYCAQKNYQNVDAVFGVRNRTTGGTLVRCYKGTPRTIGGSVTKDF